MARWLTLSGEDYCCMAMRGMDDAWEPWDRPPPHESAEAVFYEAAPGHPAASGGWEHRVLRARRGAGGRSFIDVHRFTLPATPGAEVNAFLLDLAQKKESEASGCSRSNVGGFHSRDDLWRWPEMAGETGRRVAALLRSAMREVERHEEDVHRRHAADRGGFEAASPKAGADAANPAADEEHMAAQEAWLNISRAGNWNHFHTHPGSTFSGCYYVSDAGVSSASCCPARCGAESLQGRLILLTQAPESVSEHSENLVHDFLEEPMARADDKYMLAVDPVPGSLIIFPSFVPHLVLPNGLESAGCTVCRSSTAAETTPTLGARISLAFNFVCDHRAS